MPKHHKNGTTVFDAADMDSAMGLKPRSTVCRACKHPRGDHKKILDPADAGKPFFAPRNDTYGECERLDRRRTTSNGVCPCVGFVEPRVGESNA
jgi:hypothetical protein